MSISITPRPDGSIPSNARLYSMGQIRAATFFATPLAGCWLIGSNLTELDFHDTRRQALTWGAALTAALILLAFVLPESFPDYVLPALGIAAVEYVAKRLHGEEFDKRFQPNLKQSSWRVAGICAFALVCILGAFVAAALILPEPAVMINEYDRVYYLGDATEEDAWYLGEILTQQGFFPSSGGADVEIERSEGQVAISFVMANGGWENPAAVIAFTALGNIIADQPSIGRPLTIKLVSDLWVTQESLTID